jgi:hypothetical protein
MWKTAGLSGRSASGSGSEPGRLVTTHLVTVGIHDSAIADMAIISKGDRFVKRPIG